MVDYISEIDKELSCYNRDLQDRISKFNIKFSNITRGSGFLSENCNSHLYYGMHRYEDKWIFREWAPNAKSVYIIGEFNGWQKENNFSLKKIDNGNWEIEMEKSLFSHGDLYKLYIEWEDGAGERIPSHAKRVIQDEYTKVFCTQIWEPEEKYIPKHNLKTYPQKPLIYEVHIGMSTEYKRVSTFREFQLFILPRIAKLGYNTIQIMGIQEHPYYGSFGYQVSNFFAVSSRFGTPEDLKELIDEAHKFGIAVIMDIVHSHSVKNESEGLSRFDGTYNQYFYEGERGSHKLWGSRCFDYGKDEVLNFLLSNCKYWLEEFNFDGFRFDGITSMIYIDHGINKDFTSYDMYFDKKNRDDNAITYLSLANKLIHELNPNAITIAEDMSGMPGMGYPIEGGGIGFDYRMSMGIPDYWIKLIKTKKDEEWHVGDIFYELTNKRKEEETISYVESHDQALVGDKTVFFRLTDKEVYTGMGVFDNSIIIERAIALHKIIRLLTIGTASGGYLTFMGNEWGHPEWIDFPREGNKWEYTHARRLWSLLDNPMLKFKFLNEFDKAMINTFSQEDIMYNTPIPIVRDIEKQILIFTRGDFLFVVNINPQKSFDNYKFITSAGKYNIILNSDDKAYNGQNRVDNKIDYFTEYNSNTEKNILSLYLPSRIALLLKRS